MARFSILGLALGLAGCAAGHLAESLPQAGTPVDLSEPNYRQIVADNIAGIFANAGSLAPMEISAARPVDHLRGPAWLTCLRIAADRAPQEYALFIQGDKIIDQRAGVAIDRCKQQAYEPFDPASFKQPPPPPPGVKQRKKAGR